MRPPQQRHRVLRALCDGAPAGIDAGGEPRVPAPSRRDARGDPASRDPAAADQPVVAGAPAVLPAAGDGRGAHHRRAAAAASKAASAGGGSGSAPRSCTSSAAVSSSAQTRKKRSRRPRPSTPSSPAEIGATVYQVGIYCAIRDPRGEQREFQRLVGDTAREFHALTNARVVRGRRLCLPGFDRDAAARRRPAAGEAQLRAAEHRALRAADARPAAARRAG